MGLELVSRASLAVLALIAPAVVAGGVLAGWPGAVGVASGGLLSLASLHWTVRGVRSAGRFFSGGRAHPLWLISLGARYILFFAVVAALLASGAAHPVALMGGLSILPPVLIGLGLRAARAGS